MKRFLVCALVAGVSFGLAVRPAHAMKAFGDAFTAYYVDGSAVKNDEFKKLAKEAKCNVCHVDGEDKKKVRNPYGEELHKHLKWKEFKDRIKTEPAKCKEEIEAAFKKVEEAKAKDGKKFIERMNAGMLPGGDAKGKN